jgi:hypothetical protein
MAIGAISALAASPALALAADPPGGPPSTTPPANQGTAHMPSTTPAPAQSPTPGPGASLPEKAKAYGVHCQGQSKKHVAGQKGTPFSQCVTAMAKLANGTTDSPRAACKNLSRKHVAGKKGTPFSRCVSEGAKLLKET